MSKLTIAKFAINAIVGAGVSKVTHDIISNNTTVDSTEDQVKVVIGSVVIGMMVVEKSQEYVGEKVDAVAEWNLERKERKAEKKAKKEATEK